MENTCLSFAIKQSTRFVFRKCKWHFSLRWRALDLLCSSNDMNHCEHDGKWLTVTSNNYAVAIHKWNVLKSMNSCIEFDQQKHLSESERHVDLCKWDPAYFRRTLVFYVRIFSTKYAMSCLNEKNIPLFIHQSL